jgi:hypothetical protein
MAILGTSPIVQANTFFGNGGAPRHCRRACFRSRSISVRPGPRLPSFRSRDSETRRLTTAWLTMMRYRRPRSDRGARPTCFAATIPSTSTRWTLDRQMRHRFRATTDTRDAKLDTGRTGTGLVRAVDAAGFGGGAAVRVIGRDGTQVLDAITRTDGHAPATVDPSRSPGLSDREAGGPVPHWPIFTETDHRRSRTRTNDDAAHDPCDQRPRIRMRHIFMERP